MGIFPMGKIRERVFLQILQILRILQGVAHVGHMHAVGGFFMAYAPGINIRAVGKRPLVEFTILLHIMSGKPYVLHHAPWETEIFLIIPRPQLLLHPFDQIGA